MERKKYIPIKRKNRMKLIKDATNVKIYGYSFKSRDRSRKNLIKEANENSIFTLIKKLETKEEKRNLIAQRNPLHYAFGEKLVVRRYGESYEDYVSRQYIGGLDGHR
jgi:hypothetical protein